MMQAKHVLLLLALFMVSCSQEIEITDYLDSTKDFKIVNQLETKDLNAGIEIQVRSEKHKGLLNWLNDNTQDWESSPASYQFELAVFQDDFKLLILKESKAVVIAFTDKSGKPRQYLKSVNPEKLTFLYK